MKKIVFYIAFLALFLGGVSVSYAEIKDEEVVVEQLSMSQTISDTDNISVSVDAPFVHIFASESCSDNGVTVYLFGIYHDDDNFWDVGTPGNFYRGDYITSQSWNAPSVNWMNLSLVDYYDEKYSAFVVSASCYDNSTYLEKRVSVIVSRQSIQDGLASTTSSIRYSDWLFVQGIIIFLLLFIPIGFVFSILKKDS